MACVRTCVAASEKRAAEAEGERERARERARERERAGARAAFRRLTEAPRRSSGIQRHPELITSSRLLNATCNRIAPPLREQHPPLLRTAAAAAATRQRRVRPPPSCKRPSMERLRPLVSQSRTTF